LILNSMQKNVFIALLWHREIQIRLQVSFRFLKNKLRRIRSLPAV
jgi:hypothetical protein